MNPTSFESGPGKRELFYVFMLAAMLMVPALAKAQMFSVKSAHSVSYDIPHIHIYAGAGPVRFTYRPNNDNNLYAFSGQALQFVLEANSFKIFLGTGLSLGQESFFDAGIQGGYQLSLYRDQKIHFGYLSNCS